MALLATGACRRADVAGCLQRCARVVGEQSPACRTICSHNCRSLERTYAMRPEVCRYLHEGGREP